MEKDNIKYNFIVDTTIRGLIKKMNEAKVKKENVVSMLYNNQYILVYAE